MNILLWVLQVLLALHTLAGALWKFSRPVPLTLSAIPHAVWLALAVLEIIASVALVLPAFRRATGRLPVLACGFIALVMALFTILHIASGSDDLGQPVYWLVVAGVCAFIGYGRSKVKPHR